MKKLITAVMLAATLFAFSGSASAANMVSRMATEKGGLHVAACAQMMERGVSACATASHTCEK